MRSQRKKLTLLGPAIILASVLCGTIWGQSALTTIQDTLFDADGQRYYGSLTIQWSTFDTNNPGTIVQQSRTVQVVNGNLLVQLAPNSAATPPANVYSVLYQSDGDQQYTETWTVPVSATPLRVAQVRTGAGVAGSGSAGGLTGGSTGTVTEASVTNLVSDLNARPIKGPGYGTNAVAVVDQNGLLETAVGNLGDCLFVDGTTGPCTSGLILPTFINGEVPGGLVNGLNATFTLANTPSGTSLLLFRNGILLQAGTDYALTGSTVQFASGAIPQPQDTLMATYRLDSGSSGSSGSPATGPSGVPGINGCGAVGTASKSAAYQIQASDNGYLLIQTTSAGFALPVTVPAVGWCAVLLNTNSGSIAVSNNGNAINGVVGAYALASTNAVAMISDGTRYWTSGANGQQGPTGATGIQGVAGATGPSGAQGIAGPTGTAGAAGVAGATGPQGAVGATGLSGAQGIAGPTGTAGTAGVAGVAGATGPQGVAGATGSTGAQGIAGPAGTGGATGAAGPTGSVGATGASLVSPTANLFTEVTPTVRYVASSLTYANGSTVSTWSDSSGHGNNASLTSGAPVMNRQTTSGVPAVHFGGSDWMGIPGSASFNQQSATVCTVIENINPSSATMVYLNLGSGGSGPADWYLQSESSGLYTISDEYMAGENTVASLGVHPAAMSASCTAMSSSAVTAYRPDGSVYTGSALASGSVTGGQIASWTTGGSYQYAGNMYEIDVFPSALTLNQIQEWFAYSRATYGTPQYGGQVVRITKTGDSITAGVNSTLELNIQNQSYPNWKSGQFIPVELNYGQGGQTLQAVSAGTVAAITAAYNSGYALNVLEISYGFNDIVLNAATAASVEGYLNTYISSIHTAQPGWMILVDTVTPYNVAGCATDSIRNTFNSWLLASLPANVNGIVNYTVDSVMNTCQATNSMYYTGYHPTNSGYERLARIRRNYLDLFIATH